MVKFLTEHKYISLLVLIFIIAEILVFPVGNFPLNDDWSYARAVVVFNDKAEFNFGVWPAMTLCSHILWGSVFTKIFGFSHFVLRFSSMISALIAIVFLYKLVRRISGNIPASVVVCAVMLFNPIYFNLVNTYMTDVNFCTLTIVCCYYIYRFHETQKLIYFLPVFIFSALLVLVRQFGIIVPACFILSCFFTKENRWRAVLMSAFVFVLVIVVFKIYEGYLQRILPKNSTYKFSGNFNILSGVFWDNFFIGVTAKYAAVLLHILIYIFPLTLILIKDIIVKAGTVRVVIAIVISVLASYFLFRNEAFPSQNIFNNMSLGPETFYESTQGRRHAVSEQFQTVMNVVKYLCTSVSLFVIVLLMIKRPLKRLTRINVNATLIFLLCFGISYVFMMFITESYFDRYNLPIIIVSFIIFSYSFSYKKIKLSLAFIPLVFLAYVSIAGTKDYFSWNEKKWEAYYFLNREHKVKNEMINAGFEVGCWTDQGYILSYNYLEKNGMFIIQFDNEEGFRLLRQYEFQRYFPYKKDYVNILIRE